jgi:hypothetical protein
MRPLKSICRSNLKNGGLKSTINSTGEIHRDLFLCGPHCNAPCSSPPRRRTRLQAQPPTLLFRLPIHNRFLKPHATMDLDYELEFEMPTEA